MRGLRPFFQPNPKPTQVKSPARIRAKKTKHDAAPLPSPTKTHARDSAPNGIHEPKRTLRLQRKRNGKPKHTRTQNTPEPPTQSHRRKHAPHRKHDPRAENGRRNENKRNVAERLPQTASQITQAQDRNGSQDTEPNTRSTAKTRPTRQDATRPEQTPTATAERTSPQPRRLHPAEQNPAPNGGRANETQTH